MLFSHCLIVVHTKPPIFISFVLNTVGLLLGKLKTQTEALLYVYRHFFVDDVFLWLGFNVFITCQVRVCRRKKWKSKNFTFPFQSHEKIYFQSTEAGKGMIKDISMVLNAAEQPAASGGYRGDGGGGQRRRGCRSSVGLVMRYVGSVGGNEEAEGAGGG